MSSLVLPWLTALSLSASVLAATPELDEATRRFLEIVNRPVAIESESTAPVKVIENRSYRRDVAGALADVHLPGTAAARAPLVILVHGGVGADFPVRPKDWGLYRSWGRVLARSGFVAVTFNHRLGFPAPMIEEAASDLDSLTRFVRAHAREWNADPDRIAIAVYSAGGMLLASALKDPVPWLRSVVAFYPIIDLTVSAHLRQQLAPEQLERHSLGTLMPAIAGRMPPLLLVRAGRDEIPDLLAGLDRFVGQAMAANAPVVVVNHREAAHGFDSQEPTPRTRAVLHLAIGFLRETLVPASASPPAGAKRGSR
jgi:acetyl esterase/lipase